MADTALRPGQLPALAPDRREPAGGGMLQYADAPSETFVVAEGGRSQVAVGSDGGTRILPRGIRPPAQGRVAVNRWNALSVVSLFRCCDLISGKLAEMPLVPAAWNDSPLEVKPYIPLLVNMDPDLSQAEAIKQLQFGVLLDGEAACLITSRDADGFAETVRVLRYYDWWPDMDAYTQRPKAYWVYGERRPTSDVIHFRGLTLPGEFRGIPPLVMFDRVLSNAMAQDESAVEMLVSGAVHQGYFTHPQTPSPEAVTDTKEAWRDGVAGRDRTPPVFVGGLQFHPLNPDPASLQLLDSRKYNALEVCVAYGVRPHVIGVPEDHSFTYSSALMENRSFVAFSLSNWMTLFAGTLSRYMRPGIKCRFNPRALLEPDEKVRAETDKIGVEMGWLGGDEVRQREGLPPRDDLVPQARDAIRLIQERLPADPATVDADV